MGRGRGSNGGGRGRAAQSGAATLGVREQADFARAVRRDALPSSLTDRQLARAFAARAHGPGGTYRDVLDGHMVFDTSAVMARQGGIVREAVRRGLVDAHEQGGQRNAVGYRLSTKGQAAAGVTFANSRRVAEQHAGFPKARAIAARKATAGPKLTAAQVHRQVLRSIRATPHSPAGRDLVAVHAIRDHAERAVGGPIAAGLFAASIRRLHSKGKHKVIAISDNRDMTQRQLDRSIQGMNETLAYVVRGARKRRR